MGYLGRDIQYGSFAKQTLTANSSTTVFTLSNGVADANNLLVSIGGIIQEPNVAYTATGTVITFASAPVTNDPIFITFLGMETTTAGSSRDDVTYQIGTGNGTTTPITLSMSVVNSDAIRVSLNGVVQKPWTDFTASGTTLTFSTAPDATNEILVYYIGKEDSISDVATGSVTAAKLTASGTMPAWVGTNITGIDVLPYSKFNDLKHNLALIGFRRSQHHGTSNLDLPNGFIDQFQDQTNVDDDASVGETWTAAGTISTSYTDPYSTGDRRSLITVTSGPGDDPFNIQWGNNLGSDLNTLVDASKTGPGNDGFYFGGGSVAGKYFLFTLAEPKVFTGHRWWNDENNDPVQGTWQMQGSNSDTGDVWTDIGGTWDINNQQLVSGSLPSYQNITTMSGNTTAYKYYRMMGISGTHITSSNHLEIEFEAGDSASNYYYTNSGDTTTIPASASDWAGNTSGNTFSSGRVFYTNGANPGDEAVRSATTLSGDFELEVTMTEGESAGAWIGVFPSADQATFNGGHELGNLHQMSNSAFFASISRAGQTAGFSARVSGGENVSAYSSSNGDVIKIKRVGSTLTNFLNGTLKHTETGFSTGTMYVMIGGGGASSSVDSDYTSISWTILGAANNMTLISESETAATAPEKAYVTLFNEPKGEETQPQVAQNLGTIIASIGTGANEAGRLFDGNRTGPNHSGAGVNDFAGKDWGNGVTKTITGFKAWNNENTHGFNVGGGNIEAKLQGSSNGSSWTDLGTTGSVADGAGQPTPYMIGKMSGNTTTTAYRYHRVLFNNTVDIRWNEIEFYETLPAPSIVPNTDIMAWVSRSTKTVTATNASNVLNATAHGLSNGGRVMLSTTGTTTLQEMTHFDGGSDWLNIAEGTLGATDGKSFTICFYIRMLADSTTARILSTTNGRFNINLSTNNAIYFLMRDSSNNTALNGDSAASLKVADGLTHVAISIDAANSTGHIRLNNDSAIALSVTNRTIDITQADFVIGDTTGGGGVKINADIGRFYLTQEYIDISNNTNLAKFIDADNNPVDMGADGSTPSGNQPLIFLNNAFGTFQTNAGSGGNFTENGTLTQGTNLTETDLPAGLSTLPIYHVVNKTANTFQVAATNGGAAVTFSDDGTGTHSARSLTSVTLADKGDYGTGKTILAGTADITGQPTGTDVRLIVQTKNNKETNLHGTAVQYGKKDA